LLKRLPLFSIIFTTVFFAAFVLTMTALMSTRVNERVYRWPLANDGGLINVTPDMTQVYQPVDLFVVVHGENGRTTWRWDQSNVLVFRILEKDEGHQTRQTGWCTRMRIRHAALRDGHGCQLFYTWDPATSTSLNATGKMVDAPEQVTIELVAVPTGFVDKAKTQRARVFACGLGYLIGCWITLIRVRKRHQASVAP
jgi:hypothetical protein